MVSVRKYYWILFLLLPFTVGASTCWWFTAFVGEDSENSPTEVCLEVFPTPTQAIPLIPQGNPPPPGDPIIQEGEPVGNPPPEELPPAYQPTPTPEISTNIYYISIHYEYMGGLLPACTGNVNPPGIPLSTIPGPPYGRWDTHSIVAGGTAVFNINCGSCGSVFVYVDPIPPNPVLSYTCPSAIPPVVFSNVHSNQSASVLFW